MRGHESSLLQLIRLLGNRLRFQLLMALMAMPEYVNGLRAVPNGGSVLQMLSQPLRLEFVSRKLASPSVLRKEFFIILFQLLPHNGRDCREDVGMLSQGPHALLLIQLQEKAFLDQVLNHKDVRMRSPPPFSFCRRL